jgi:putative ABC transport system permease protein
LGVGAGLLSYRLTNLFVGRGRRLVGIVLRPVAGGLSDTVAASMQRQRRLIARGAALNALTVGFAVSTAVFNDTYRQQAEVDAVLTNGADVTVTTSPGTTVSPTSAAAVAIAATNGVKHVEPIQHRFAYVGADLQDLYGVNTSTIVNAGRLQNAYFQGGTARQLVATLGAKPDSLLVSAETVHDFQLLPGDAIKLRLQDGKTKQYVDVAFHYVGVAKEFPTAPHDSFLLANADYIAKMTGSDTVGAFLVDTGGSNVTNVADALRQQLGTTATVTDIASSRTIIGSSLTAVDLHGLTQVELGFALALAAAATGLTLWLGLAERRRTFAIAAALGANRRQLGAFVWAEAGIVTLAGLATGAATAWALSNMLVKVLHGVFDPAPDTLAVPWPYLAVVLAITIVATAIAATSTIRSARIPHVELLRTL